MKWQRPALAILLTTAAIGYLAESLTLSDRVTIRPRFQPLSVAPDAGASVMAVVRIQPTASFKDTPALRTATTEALAKVANQQNLHALQIDFDATQSQRPFYTAILKQLRPQMPPHTLTLL